MNGIVLPGLFCLLSFGLFAENPFGAPECKQTPGKTICSIT